MPDNSSYAFGRLHRLRCEDIILAIGMIKTILLLFLCTFILYLSLQQWRQQRSFKNHSDLFTCHLAAMELLGVFGFFCKLRDGSVWSTVGLCASAVGFCGEILFHILTCVERYLAVAQPVTYLGLKSSRGIRIRNVTIGCVWLLCFGMTGIKLGTSRYAAILLLCLLVVSIIAISFCSVSVLCVLIGPGPGGGEKERLDQSKQRAFQTTMLIWSLLCWWFVVLLSLVILENSPPQNQTVCCLVKTSVNVFNLLTCLVLPVLFLHRTGKLSCCSQNQQGHSS